MTEQATNGAADEQQPQFSLQRIYLRDLSFESPKSRKSSARNGTRPSAWT